MAVCVCEVLFCLKKSIPLQLYLPLSVFMACLQFWLHWFFSLRRSCFRLRGACDEWLEVSERSGIREREKETFPSYYASMHHLHTHTHTHAALFRPGLRDRCRNDWKRRRRCKLWHSQIQNSLPFGKRFSRCFKRDAVTPCAAYQISHNTLCF